MLMTKKNIQYNYPFLLSPVGKDYLWGGTKLKSEFNKNIDLDIIAETWECSTNPDGYSYIATGEFEMLRVKCFWLYKEEHKRKHNKKKSEGIIPSEILYLHLLLFLILYSKI